MENSSNNIKNISNDYNRSNDSYVEIILSLLPEDFALSTHKELIRIIYRDYLKNANRNIVMENERISSLIREKMIVDRDTLVKRAKELYTCFLYPSIFWTSQRETLFIALNYSVKTMIGDFHEYEQNKVYSYGTRGNLGV